MSRSKSEVVYMLIFFLFFCALKYYFKWHGVGASFFFSGFFEVYRCLLKRILLYLIDVLIKSTT
jgi:hypothetical protein